MTVYALRLENSADTAARVRLGDLLGLAPGSAPLKARGGLRPDGGGSVAVVTSTMQVTVQPFIAWVQGGVSVAQGGYPFVCDAAETLAVADGDPTQPRTDTVCAVVEDDNYDGSGSFTAELRVVQGTPGAGAPALPTNAVPLRDVTVPAGLSTGTGGLQPSHLGTDRRVYQVAAGGIIPLAGQVERDALTPYEGQAVYRRDTDQVELYDGSKWTPQSIGTQVMLMASGDLTLTTSGQQVPGLTYTINSPGTWAKWWVGHSLDANIGAPGAVLAQIQVDGANLGGLTTLSLSVAGRTPLAKSVLVENLTPGNHVVRVMANVFSAVAAQIIASGSNMTVSRVA